MHIQSTAEVGAMLSLHSSNAHMNSFFKLKIIGQLLIV